MLAKPLSCVYSLLSVNCNYPNFSDLHTTSF